MKQVLMSHFLFSFLAPSLRLSAGHYYWWGIDWQQRRAPTRAGSEIFWVIAKSLQQGQLC